ncbi:MAG: phosphotransferase [Bacteroidales bacterium]|jgi:aminoglycoside/choline kinase family phosphotransferase|nr:phosphotransferase [Bacteroidales bacterium]
MNVKEKVIRFYRLFRKKEPLGIDSLKGSGSYRRYFRIHEEDGTILAACNDREEENEAFVGFTRHFRIRKLPVPEVFAYYREDHIYFLEDLGPRNLYECLTGDTGEVLTDQQSLTVYRKALRQLVRFQTTGYEGLDLDLCYPHRSFDSRSMMWDMNYFKYMFLNLMAVPYHERRLEHDLETLRDHLLKARSDFFLYRDFQSANIIIRDMEPWFIDYQGGRRGAPQYDVASLLYDAKAHINAERRELLLNEYLEEIEAGSGMSRAEFLLHYPAFAMIRLMQALGAFGFRGLYEKKETFAESIVPAVGLLTDIVDNQDTGVGLRELFSTIRSISAVKKFDELRAECISQDGLHGSRPNNYK